MPSTDPSPFDATTARAPAARLPQWSLVVILLIFGGSAGCRGRAKRDLYTQKLQQEVRVLEDQLYEADYENRVLIEKLRRTRTELALEEEVPPARPDLPPPRRPSGREPLDESPQDRQRKPPRRPATPVPDDRPDSQPGEDLFDPSEAIDEGDLVDPSELLDPGNLPDGPGPLPPPPGLPEPPGPDDLRIDPIEKGEILPPPTSNGRPEGPPGKIELPDLSLLGGLGPVAGASPKIVLRTSKIEIDTSQTRPHLTQNAATETGQPSQTVTAGIDLVIRGIDQYGHPIGLLPKTHDPTARLASSATPPTRPISDPQQPPKLSVLLLDAAKTGDEAKLGRWEFDETLLSRLQQQSPDGFTIRVPIRWQEARPSGDEVIVFARLQGAGRDMRCEAEVPLNPTPSVAGWLPRH